MQPPLPFVSTPYIPPGTHASPSPISQFPHAATPTAQASVASLPHPSYTYAQITQNLNTLQPVIYHSMPPTLHQHQQDGPMTLTHNYDIHHTPTPMLHHQQAGQTSDGYGSQPSTASTLSYAHTSDAGPMAPLPTAGSGVNMSWANPAGAFEYDHQYSDGMGVFGTQYHLEGGGVDDGYGDEVGDGDITLQPGPGSHEPLPNCDDEEDFFTNMQRQDSSLFSLQHSASAPDHGQHLDQTHRASTEVHNMLNAQGNQRAPSIPPVLERHSSFPPPRPSPSHNQNPSIDPQELRRRLTEPTHQVSRSTLCPLFIMTHSTQSIVVEYPK